MNVPALKQTNVIQTLSVTTLKGPMFVGVLMVTRVLVKFVEVNFSRVFR